MRNQLESVTRPEMTNKFTMREMIDETIGVYKNLHEQALAEEKAAADALAVRRHKKVFGVTSEPIVNKKTANKVRLVKDKPNTSYSTKVTEEPNDA